MVSYFICVIVLKEYLDYDVDSCLFQRVVKGS